MRADRRFRHGRAIGVALFPLLRRIVEHGPQLVRELGQIELRDALEAARGGRYDSLYGEGLGRHGGTLFLKVFALDTNAARGLGYRLRGVAADDRARRRRVGDRADDDGPVGV